MLRFGQFEKYWNIIKPCYYVIFVSLHSNEKRPLSFDLERLIFTYKYIFAETLYTFAVKIYIVKLNDIMDKKFLVGHIIKICKQNFIYNYKIINEKYLSNHLNTSIDKHFYIKSTYFWAKNIYIRCKNVYF